VAAAANLSVLAMAPWATLDRTIRRHGASIANGAPPRQGPDVTLFASRDAPLALMLERVRAQAHEFML
jgi:hypothetical protein